MKLIISIIQPHKLEDVKQALYNAQIHSMTVSNALGSGRQKGYTEIYRGEKEVGNLIKKVRLDIAVDEDVVEEVIRIIKNAARTGEAGDGKIFVVDLEECIRISTGEKGETAIG